MHDPSRSQEAAAVIRSVVRWATRRPDVRAVALAGSRARGNPRPDSDVDLVLLVDDPQTYLDAAGPLGGPVVDVRTRWWGPVLERRFRLPSRLEVELGFAPVHWAAVPVDAGTRRVVAGGFVVLHDPSGLLGRLVREVAGES
jgi:hypothetical protein